MQRRDAVHVHRVDVRPRGDERRDDIDVSARGRVVKRRAPDVVSSVPVRVAREEELGGFGVALVRRVV